MPPTSQRVWTLTADFQMVCEGTVQRPNEDGAGAPAHNETLRGQQQLDPHVGARALT
jgi:hypothetical protein